MTSNTTPNTPAHSAVAQSAQMATPQTPLTRMFARVLALWGSLEAALAALQPPAALLARVYVAQVFFMSGLTKLRDWDITLALFADEYHVPLLPTPVAAAMGTTGELVLPVLLVLGLGGRFAALGLSVVNVVAVVSLADIAPAALQQHITWGVLLGGLVVAGAGPWSVDALFHAARRTQKVNAKEA